MSDAPARKLTLVDAALAEVPHDEKAEPALRRTLQAFAPSIAKAARKAEREAIFAAVGARSIDDLALLPKVKQELREGHEREEAKHAIGNRWRGRVEGIIAGAALACLAIFIMQGVIWDTAARSFREQAMTGALLSSQEQGQ